MGYDLKPIPGFKQLKAWHYANLWYIIDCTDGCGDPYVNSIGPRFETYGLLCSYVSVWYLGQYT